MLTTPIIVCPLGSDPIQPGYILGQQCYLCGEHLQISQNGLYAVVCGARPVCRLCSGRLREELERSGIPVQEERTPEPDRQIPANRGLDDILERLRAGGGTLA
jgi:hypothetical protein